MGPSTPRPRPAAGACSGGGDRDDTASSGAAADVGEAAPGAGAGAAGGDVDEATAGAVGGLPPGVPLAAGRAVISTATVTARVDDVEAAARQAGALAVAAGGFLDGQQARLDEGEVQVTLRVPSARFVEVLEGLSGLGEVVEADVTTQDVTAEVVDLESRIASARASVDRLRNLLERAGDVAQLVTVEGELARREAELEALLGRLRVLEDQVDLSTLHVRFTEVVPPGGGDVPGFVEALARGWSTFVAVGRVGLAGVGYALPFAALALVAALAVAVVRRSPRPSPTTGGADR